MFGRSPQTIAVAKTNTPKIKNEIGNSFCDGSKSEILGYIINGEGLLKN